MLITKLFKNKIIFSCLFLVLTLAASQNRSTLLTAENKNQNALPYEPNRYGIVYLYPHVDWGVDKRAEMDAVLADSKAKGTTTVIQTFSSYLVGTAEEENWLIFLDAAAEAEIDVVAYLWPATTYPVVGESFFYDDLKAFLDVVGEHEALIGYVGLHEPIEQSTGIDEDELRGFYTEMKAYAPNLSIAHYLGNIAYAEAHRTDGWTFTNGVCDICILWYYPFLIENGLPVYDFTELITHLDSNLDLVRDADPNAEFWFLGQTFSSVTSKYEFRMPSADEMETLYQDVMQYPIDGFLWYPCIHAESYDHVLCDIEFEIQQDAVGEIGNTLANLPKQYLPVVLHE